MKYSSLLLLCYRNQLSATAEGTRSFNSHPSLRGLSDQNSVTEELILQNGSTLTFEDLIARITTDQTVIPQLRGIALDETIVELEGVVDDPTSITLAITGDAQFSSVPGQAFYHDLYNTLGTMTNEIDLSFTGTVGRNYLQVEANVLLPPSVERNIISFGYLGASPSVQFGFESRGSTQSNSVNRTLLFEMHLPIEVCTANCNGEGTRESIYLSGEGRVEMETNGSQLDSIEVQAGFIAKGSSMDAKVTTIENTFKSCPHSSDVSREDCAAAGLSVGGRLRNGNLVVGNWIHVSFGCSLQGNGGDIHYNKNREAKNYHGYIPVCKKATDEESDHLWNGAFGIPILHVSSIVGGASFTIRGGEAFPPLPDNLGLWTSICLGTEENCTPQALNSEDNIRASSLIHVAPNSIDENALIVLLSDVSLEKILNVAGGMGDSVRDSMNAIKSVLPANLLQLEIKPFDDSECSSVDPAPASISDLILEEDCYVVIGFSPRGEDEKSFNGITIPRGLSFKGSVHVAQSSAKVETVLDILEPGADNSFTMRLLDIELAMGDIIGLIGLDGTMIPAGLSGIGIQNGNIDIELKSEGSEYHFSMSFIGNPRLPDFHQGMSKMEEEVLQILHNSSLECLGIGLETSLSKKNTGYEGDLALSVALPPAKINNNLALRTQSGVGPSLFVDLKSGPFPSMSASVGLSLTLEICTDCDGSDPPRETDCDRFPALDAPPSTKNVIYLTGIVGSSIHSLPAVTIDGDLSMSGTWFNAFGIPIVHLSNIIAGASFDLAKMTPLSPPPPTRLVLGGEICLGTRKACENKKVTKKNFIAALLYAKLDVNQPSRSGVIAMISTCSLKHIIRVASGMISNKAERESKMNAALNLLKPYRMLAFEIAPYEDNCDTGALDVNNLDCSVHVAIAPLQDVELDEIGLTIKRGINFGGTLKFTYDSKDYYIKAKGNIDMIEPSIFLHTKISGFSLFDNFVQVGEIYDQSTGETSGDAEFYLNLEKGSLVLDVRGALAIPSLKTYGQVDFHLSENLASMEGQLKLFDFVEVSAKLAMQKSPPSFSAQIEKFELANEMVILKDCNFSIESGTDRYIDMNANIEIKPLGIDDEIGFTVDGAEGASFDASLNIFGIDTDIEASWTYKPFSFLVDLDFEFGDQIDFTGKMSIDEGTGNASFDVDMNLKILGLVASLNGDITSTSASLVGDMTIFEGTPIQSTTSFSMDATWGSINQPTKLAMRANNFPFFFLMIDDCSFEYVSSSAPTTLDLKCGSISADGIFDVVRDVEITARPGYLSFDANLFNGFMQLKGSFTTNYDGTLNEYKTSLNLPEKYSARIRKPQTTFETALSFGNSGVLSPKLTLDLTLGAYDSNSDFTGFSGLLASTKKNNGFNEVESMPSSSLVQLAGSGSVGIEWNAPMVSHKLSFTAQSSFLYEYDNHNYARPKTTFFLKCEIDFNQEGEFITDELSEFPLIGDVFSEASMGSSSSGELALEFVNDNNNGIEYSLEFDIHVPGIDVTGLLTMCTNLKWSLDNFPIDDAVGLIGPDAKVVYNDIKYLLSQVIGFLNEVKNGGEFYLKLTNIGVAYPLLTVEIGTFKLDMGLNLFNLDIGDRCILDEQCTSDRCHHLHCKEKEDVGYGCGDDGDCKDGLQCVTTGRIGTGSLNECSHGNSGDHCWFDGDCKPELSCIVVGLVSKGCSGESNGDPCNSDSGCESGRCHHYICTAKVGVGHGCGDDGDCQDELECVFTGNYLGTGSINECSRGHHGDFCWEDADCTGGRQCVRDSKCSDGRHDSACTWDSDCKKGHHCARNLACSDGRAGSACTWNEDCKSGDCSWWDAMHCK